MADIRLDFLKCKFILNSPLLTSGISLKKTGLFKILANSILAGHGDLETLQEKKFWKLIAKFHENLFCKWHMR